MTEPVILTPSASITITAPRSQTLLLWPGDEPRPALPDDVVEVSISAALPAAVLVNAAAHAADQGLRAIDPNHPAHRLAQCSRTFMHAGHDTTEGWCNGLDGTEAAQAQHEARQAANGQDTLPNPIMIRVPDGTDLSSVVVTGLPDGQGWFVFPASAKIIDLSDHEAAPPPVDDTERRHWPRAAWAGECQRLEAGLRVLSTRGCENFTTGDCWGNGRKADATYAGDLACAPCIATRILDGRTLPTEESRRG